LKVCNGYHKTSRSDNSRRVRLHLLPFCIGACSHTLFMLFFPLLQLLMAMHEPVTYKRTFPTTCPDVLFLRLCLLYTYTQYLIIFCFGFAMMVAYIIQSYLQLIDMFSAVVRSRRFATRSTVVEGFIGSVGNTPLVSLNFLFSPLRNNPGRSI
jgi:hypothetical protein